MHPDFVRRFARTCAVALCVAAAACETSDPTGLVTDTVTLEGRVVSLTSAGGAAASPAQSGGSSLAGIEVSVEGSDVTTLTESDGSFRLEVEAGDDRITIRFRRDDVDVSLSLEGVTPGTTIQLDVSLGDGGSVLHRDDRHDDDGPGHDDDDDHGDGDDDHNGNDDDDGDDDFGVHQFEGRAALLALTGDAPERVAQVELSHNGSELTVEIREASTAFESDGDVLTFGDLLAALDRTDLTVEIEGDGDAQGDGTVLATSIKVETDEHADDDDDGDDDAELVEFKGSAHLVSVSGAAPMRVVRVSVDDDHGTVLVDLVEGETSFDHSGDFLTVGSALAALELADLDRLEGEGLMDADGVIVATTVRAELD